MHPTTKKKISIVIPAYKVENHIKNVLSAIPNWVDDVIVVDDASPDGTETIIREIMEKDSRITYIKHLKNQGVGGAMLTGFSKALSGDVDIVVKVDGDDQMDLTYLPQLISPLIRNQADFVKGNRFVDLQSLRVMPVIRRVGNLILSFLVKAATGYWNIFDPTNGFIAVRKEILSLLPLEKIDRTFYFETSMLANLYLINAKVADVSIPARYGNEVSNLNIKLVLIQFPLKILKTLFNRILFKYFLYDFNMVSIYLLLGFPMFLFGLIFGVIKWIEYFKQGIPAPTGTVMLPTMTVLLGIQFLLSAIQIDLARVPSEPISVNEKN
jgi:glycosyltransferase involved in cell wall biosynthesis